MDLDMDVDLGLDDPPRKTGTRALFYLALVFVLAGAGAYAYATNYNGFRDAVSTVRQTVEPGQHTLTAQETEPDSSEVERLARRLEDLELGSAVRDAFSHHPQLGLAAVQVRVEDAAVTLAGTVPASGWKHAAEHLAGEVDGVEQVINTIKVEPIAANSGDQPRTALKVEFELYLTQAFDLTAIAVSSEGDGVRLSGTVRSVAERLLAERVAGGVEGVATVVNDLEIAPFELKAAELEPAEPAPPESAPLPLPGDLP